MLQIRLLPGPSRQTMEATVVNFPSIREFEVNVVRLHRRFRGKVAIVFADIRSAINFEAHKLAREEFHRRVNE